MPDKIEITFPPLPGGAVEKISMRPRNWKLLVKGILGQSRDDLSAAPEPEDVVIFAPEKTRAGREYEGAEMIRIKEGGRNGRR